MNKVNKANSIQIIYSRIAKELNKFNIEFIGLENIPDSPCMFICNHSNSHDFYTIQQLFDVLNRRVSVLVGSDCLNLPSRILFQLGSSIMVDRRIAEERHNSKKIMFDKLNSASDVFVFGEGTWNLHPYKLMQPISKGAVEVGCDADAYILPVVFEYVEVKAPVISDEQLFKKCIIKFAEPLKIRYNSNVIIATAMIEEQMSAMKAHLKKENNCFYQSLDDVDADIYVNHTYYKKNTPLFKFDSDYEAQFLRKVNGIEQDNEFVKNESGLLVPKRVLKR